MNFRCLKHDLSKNNSSRYCCTRWCWELGGKWAELLFWVRQKQILNIVQQTTTEFLGKKVIQPTEGEHVDDVSGSFLYLRSHRGRQRCERHSAPLLSVTLKQVMRQRQRTESGSDFKVRVGIDGSADGICTPGWIDNYTAAEIEMGSGKCLARFCGEAQMQILV